MAFSGQSMIYLDAESLFSCKLLITPETLRFLATSLNEDRYVKTMLIPSICTSYTRNPWYRLLFARKKTTSIGTPLESTITTETFTISVAELPFDILVGVVEDGCRICAHDKVGK